MKRLLITVLFFCACDPPSYKEKREPIYPQSFSEPVAFIAVDWNNRTLMGTGSGFLIDKEKGLMITAGHVSDVYKDYGTDVADAFIDGHVYSHHILREFPLRDASLVKLVDFNPDNLPDSYPIAKTKVEVGNILYVRGFHKHPNRLIKLNESEGS